MTSSLKDAVEFCSKLKTGWDTADRHIQVLIEHANRQAEYEETIRVLRNNIITRDVALSNERLKQAEMVEVLKGVQQAGIDLLKNDGGHLSECFSAMKSYDARDRLAEQLSALNAIIEGE